MDQVQIQNSKIINNKINLTAGKGIKYQFPGEPPQEGGIIEEPKRLRRDQLSGLGRYPLNDRYNKSALDEYSGEISIDLK